MTSAATVLVCALELLGRSADSLPRITLLDVRPPGASINAEAFVDPATRTIYILTTSAVFRAPLSGVWHSGTRHTKASSR
jgi:hypothetical protein